MKCHSFAPSNPDQISPTEGNEVSLQKCLQAVYLPLETGKRCDFRNKPKKAVRHIAQNEACKDMFKLSLDLTLTNIEGETGNLGTGRHPRSRLTPVRVEETNQLPAIGFGRPSSL